MHLWASAGGFLAVCCRCAGVRVRLRAGGSGDTGRLEASGRQPGVSLRPHHTKSPSPIAPPGRSRRAPDCTEDHRPRERGGTKPRPERRARGCRPPHLLDGLPAGRPLPSPRTRGCKLQGPPGQGWRSGGKEPGSACAHACQGTATATARQWSRTATPFPRPEPEADPIAGPRPLARLHICYPPIANRAVGTSDSVTCATKESIRQRRAARQLRRRAAQARNMRGGEACRMLCSGPVPSGIRNPLAPRRPAVRRSGAPTRTRRATRCPSRTPQPSRAADEMCACWRTGLAPAIYEHPVDSRSCARELCFLIDRALPRPSGTGGGTTLDARRAGARSHRHVTALRAAPRST